MQQCQVRVFVPSFDPNECCLKNGLQSEGLNPGPLGHDQTTATCLKQKCVLNRPLKREIDHWNLCNSAYFIFRKKVFLDNYVGLFF